MISTITIKRSIFFVGLNFVVATTVSSPAEAVAPMSKVDCQEAALERGNRCADACQDLPEPYRSNCVDYCDDRFEERMGACFELAN